MNDVLRITPLETAAAAAAGAAGDQPGDDRFDRFKLIGWWDQARLAQARVLVVGAGALGNEVIKNLALLGVGNLFIADMDRVENSNLSRSVLYRASDNGAFKATAAARAAKDIYPDIKVQHFNGNVVHDLGLGVFRWADVVIGGLDNREARLAINRSCWKVNRPWIDGAIESIDGSARVFIPERHPAAKPPGAPCYECTMSQQDWKLLQMRRSCNLLSRPEMATGGKTPTTPTVSSIIAGVQCQEAVKLLHGLPTIAGGAFVFNGTAADSYITRFQRKDDCYSHDTLDEIVALDDGIDTITPRKLLSRARAMLGGQAELELAREVLEKLVCPTCNAAEPIFASLGKVAGEQAWCPRCADVRREVVTFHKIRGGEAFIDRPFAAIGAPAFDIIIARRGGRSIGFELGGDAARVLGELVSSDETLELV